MVKLSLTDPPFLGSNHEAGEVLRQKRIKPASDEDKPCNAELIACIKKFDNNGLLLKNENVSLSHIYLQLAS